MIKKIALTYTLMPSLHFKTEFLITYLLSVIYKGGQACLHQICTVNRKKYLVSTGQKQEYAGPNQEPILPNQSDYEKPEYPDD